MTVLAVVGLVTTVGVLAAHKSESEDRPSAEDLEAAEQAQEVAQRRVSELERELEELRRKRETLRKDAEACEEKVGDLKKELGRNERLQTAMQRFQSIIDGIAQDDLLRFDPDQSLRLGDELVRFERNRVEPIWQPGGPQHLQHFCGRLSQEFARLEGEYPDPSSLFTIHVEGHSDSTRCLGGERDCNWSFSSQRAVNFLELMRDERFCPGGAGWRLRPIGYADTRPVPPVPGQAPVPIRRISLRVVPDYERWTSSDR